MAKKSLYERIKMQDPADNVRNRDVYENQQIETSDLGEKKGMGPYMFMAVGAALLAGLIMLMLTNTFVMIVESAKGVYGGMPSASQMFMFPHYPFQRTLIGFVSLVIFVVAFVALMLQRSAQNMKYDVSDINQHHNGQRIATPDEVMRRYDWFPDVGAHAPVEVSSMLSHEMLSNKGIKKIEMLERYQEDGYDSELGQPYYRGEVIMDEVEDEDGNVTLEPRKKIVPFIDEAFGKALYDASGAYKTRRKFVDATSIEYNPGGANRNKAKFDRVSDLINNTWEMPDYEPQRPAGAYIVDTDPVNTMVNKNFCNTLRTAECA